jgi:hypothetical protein
MSINHTQLVPPAGGRIRILRVFIDESSSWKHAIDDGFPRTLADSDVRKVGDQYPPRENIKPAERDVILLNFDHEIPNINPAVMWARANHLHAGSPCALFAIGKHHPRLHTELEESVTLVASIEECVFSGHRRILLGWWHGVKRRAYLGRPGDVCERHCWFIFVRP